MVEGTKRSKPTLEVMLENGKIDVLVSVHTPRAIVRYEGTVRYLFDSVRAVEEEYFRRARIFPMMRTIVIQRNIYDRHPWIAQSLFDAFAEAKRQVMEKLYETNALPVMAPFIVFDIERTRELMGPNYWPLGIELNPRSISTFVRNLREQDIIDKNIDISELFIDVGDTAKPPC